MNKFKIGDTIVAAESLSGLTKVGKKYLVYEIIAGHPVCNWQTGITGYIESKYFKLANKVEIKSKTVLI